MSPDEAEGPLEEWCHPLLSRNPTCCQQASLKIRVQWTVEMTAPPQRFVHGVVYCGGQHGALHKIVFVRFMGKLLLKKTMSDSGKFRVSSHFAAGFFMFLTLNK